LALHSSKMGFDKVLKDKVLEFEFRPYRRSFQQPLQTHHGQWSVREGIILRVVDASGRVGWGEIAPIAPFGSESLTQALQFCRELTGLITASTLSIPDSLPCCQFGVESAVFFTDSPQPLHPQPHSILLPTGTAALSAWQTPWQQGYRTFKWKIGVAALHDELALFEQLRAMLPPEAQLRLDANGGLTLAMAHEWLRHCDRHSIEFLEQPLAVSEFDSMLQLSQKYTTPIALDESVATLSQLETCYQQGWRGIFVVKAAIAGSPRRLQQFCQRHAIDIVWSSVFETAIARRFIEQQLIPACVSTVRAIGFGLQQWFADDEFTQPDFEQLWQRL
jgi:O-succinylbenzoate synthase